MAQSTLPCCELDPWYANRRKTSARGSNADNGKSVASLPALLLRLILDQDWRRTSTIAPNVWLPSRNDSQESR